MTEKSAGSYHYEPCPILNKQQNNDTNSLKRDDPANSLKSTGTSKSSKSRRKCCSFSENKSGPLLAGLLTNLGIFILLFAYTLLGSFIFLAIEGGASKMQPRTTTTTINRQATPNPSQAIENFAFSSKAINDATEAMQRCIDNIWEITMSLNILYKDYWTRSVAVEMAKYQDNVIKRLTEDISSELENFSPPNEIVIRDPDWTFARAFLYSLTIITTIGYGNIAPRTTLGRIVTLVYAVLGIPLTLVYLSSTGGVLARVARGVFSRALCCCLCSNCGYCCYDEKRMAEKERRMKKKRQQEEMRAQQMALQEPYYVRSGSLHNNLHSPKKQPPIPDVDSLSDSRTSMHGLSLLAPILLCMSMMIIYICMGAIALYHLEGWSLLDGFYFCFMSLSTIGFGDLLPGLHKEPTITTWFCSLYIMSGMALTAMCFNVLHEEIVHRIKHVVDINKRPKHDEDSNDYLANRRYEKNTNLYQRKPTDEILGTSECTSTSLIFGHESDLNDLHILKDCMSHSIDHELVAIVTMDPSNPDSSQPSTVILPEVLDNVPQMMHLSAQHTPAPNPSLTSGDICDRSTIRQNSHTGVYTLPEQPELEAEESYTPAMIMRQ